MPGHHHEGLPGRRAPVRGDTPSDTTTTINTATTTRQSSSAAAAAQQPGQMGGFKGLYPPSPPSTVDEGEGSSSSVDGELSGQMQGALRVRGEGAEAEEEDTFDDEVESDNGEEYDEEEEDDDDDDGAASQASSYMPASVSSSTKQQLSAAATAIAGTQRGRNNSNDAADAAVATSSLYPTSNTTHHHHQQRPSSSSNRSPSSSFSSNASSLHRLTHPRTAAITTTPHVAASRMPDTPLPSATSSTCITSLSHHPTASAQRFFAKILADFPTAKGSEGLVGVADDAGLDVGMVCPGWEGAVLDQSRLPVAVGRRTLYALLPGSGSSSASGTSASSSSAAHRRPERLREDVLALLDLASERLACSVVVIAVDKASMGDDAERKATLHGLCYVGGSVVSAQGRRDPISGCRVERGVTLVGVEL